MPLIWLAPERQGEGDSVSKSREVAELNGDNAILRRAGYESWGRTKNAWVWQPVAVEVSGEVGSLAIPCGRCGNRLRALGWHLGIG
jgi:hypothetical protein